MPIYFNIDHGWDRAKKNDLWVDFDKNNTYIIDLSEESYFDPALLPVWIANDESQTIVFLYIYYHDSTSVSAAFVIERALKMLY